MKQKLTAKRIAALALTLVLLLTYVPIYGGATGTDIQAIEKPQGISIVEDYDDYYGDNWVGELGLPQTVKITLADGTKTDTPVTWDASVINTRTPGYYSVPGTFNLPAGATNGQNLTVAITVQVRKYENLIKNPSFEENLSGWYLRGASPAPAQTNLIAADGKFSAMLGGKVVYKNASIADTRNSIITALPGAGQYYYSAQAQYAAETYPANVTLQTQLLYKTTTNSTSTYGYGNKAPINNAAFCKSSGIITMPENVNWIRMDLYAAATETVDHSAAQLCVDNAELVPLLLPLEVEPSSAKEIMTKLPVRAVIQNYPDYVGENWKAELGLPKSVEVLTDNGTTVEVDVEWDCSNLNFASCGKYVLVGTLDSTFPNPDNLTAVQIVYVQEYKNLIPNPSFEGNFTGWYLRGVNPAPSVSTDAAKQGKYAALVGTMSTTGKSSSYADSRNLVDQLGAAIALQGAGQYYFSIWAMSASDYIEGMTHEVRIGYKTVNDAGVQSSMITKIGDKMELNNKEFTQSQGLVQLPANVNWARMDLYVYAQQADDICNTRIYFDCAELIPLNVIVEQYEGSMVQVETIIPARQIIKNYPDYIGDSYTTSDLMFPETVKVRSTTGDLIDVGVRWNYSTLNLEKTGTYTVYGALEDMKLANPNALTVKQTVKVVEKQNIFVNPSFEDDLNGWSTHYMTTNKVGITNPVRTGDFSVLLNAGRLDGYSTAYLQAFYNGGPETVGQKVTKTGGGKYAFSAWVHGTKSSEDIEIQLRMLYRGLSTGDKLTTITAPRLTDLSTTEFRQVGDILTMPDDVYWARMDLYMYGSVDQLRLSEIYLEDFELIPLNVEIPNLTDIISCETTADVYVHEGASIADLKLPEALQVIIKTGQKFDLGVTWDTSSFDPDQIGEQIIEGSLNIGNTYKNPKGFIPTVRIIVRPEGSELRDTIYIANDGSEDNDGLSPDTPKSDITKIPTYLKQGMNVKLKRGDVWYLPTGSITLSGIYATEDAPLTLGAYGSGDELPTIAFLRSIASSEWTQVDEKRNVWAVDVSSFGQKYGESVHRCFVDDAAYFHVSRTNYIALKEEEFCSYNNTLYIRMPSGQTPGTVEITPYGSGGHRMLINNVTNLNIDFIHFKGSSAISSMMYIEAPTANLKFRYCAITHCFYYIMMWESADEQIHDHPEISNCYIDAMFSEKEGAWAEDGSHWAVSITEGITMRDGVDGAWLHHNHIRNMSHAFIAIESTAKGSDYDTTGVRNCIIEDNILEGGNAGYARAFNICGGYNQSGVQMCRDNTYRRNRCYDMTTSSHLYGENNLVYSNLFSYVHCTYKEDGTLLDGKTAQPWGFDTIPWSDHVSIGNMLINNTFYNVSGAIAINDQAHTVYNNLYANNLIVNFTSDVNYAGAIWDNSIDLQYVYNNGVFSDEGRIDHFVVDTEIFSAEDVNLAKAGYSGNLYGDPKFVDADLSLMDKGVRQEFVLANDSPFRYAGVSLYNNVYNIFPAWERLKAEYTDINGVVYLAESPSIGAYSFCERITGDVVEVAPQFDILGRPGTISIDQLNLPDAVSAVNDAGIDVMLLAEWKTEGVDFSKPGTVTLTAELRNGPHTQLNINGKVATINVNIKNQLELLSVTTVIKPITVLYGTSLEGVIAQLPATLDVMEESGYQEALPVTWACENYDPTRPASYTFKCVLPADMVTNAREFPLEVNVRLLHEVNRGTELLINSDFIDGTSSAPWKVGWGTGSFRITTDPQFVFDGEPAAAIVTMSGRYGSIQQDVLGQMQLMGDGKYLFVVHMRAYDRLIDSSYACLKIWGPKTYTIKCRAATDINNTDWITYSAVMDVTDVAQATEISFHTSTGKSQEDVESPAKSYIISGCSLIYLGNTDAQVTATTDMLGLDWSAICGENDFQNNVLSDLVLPTKTGSSSTVVWTSSDESVISTDGKVTLSRTPKTVKLTATITHSNGVVTTKSFTIELPRDPNLPEYTASLTGDQNVQIGQEFQVKIALNSENVTTFNTYRFTISFNADKLEFVKISDAASQTEVDGGQLIISGCGTERPVTDTFTVTFRAKKSGITEVKLILAELDLSADGDLNDLPTMTITAKSAVIDVARADKAPTDNNTEQDTESSNTWIYIVIIVVAVAAIAVVIILLLKKKKGSTPAE